MSPHFSRHLLDLVGIFFQMAFAARAKIIKPNNEDADEFEKAISQALLDLEINSDLKAQLRELYITAAKEVEVAGKKAIVIFVPVPQLKAFQKIQLRLVRAINQLCIVISSAFSCLAVLIALSNCCSRSVSSRRSSLANMWCSLPSAAFWLNPPGRPTS